MVLSYISANGKSGMRGSSYKRPRSSYNTQICNNSRKSRLNYRLTSSSATFSYIMKILVVRIADNFYLFNLYKSGSQQRERELVTDLQKNDKSQVSLDYPS